MPHVNDPLSTLAWRPWGAAAFAQARAEGRRILLWVTATWSHGCRAMAADTYADPSVVAALTTHYIPVRVDADERPDIADRYDLGGLPTTAVLEADGTLIGGGTFVSAGRLRQALERLAVAPAQASGATLVTAAVEPVNQAALLAMIDALHDREHGGCGTAPKFPLVAPIRLALRRAADGDGRGLGWALASLDAIGWGGLSDEDGGFFHYSEGVDWTSPRPEKLLTVNAALIDLFVEAALAGHGQRFVDRARSAVDFVERDLRRPDGAWRVAAGAGPTRVLTDATARTVSALLHAAHAFADERLAARALHTLEDILLATYKPGDGVGHCGGGVRGLLTDHVAMAAACLDAWDAAGQLPHRMMAEELVHHAVRTMWDSERGRGFFDRAPSVIEDDPPAVVPLTPFVLNCEAAVVLDRLAAETSDPELAARARATLAAIAPQAMSQGPLAAHYLLAARAISD